MMSVDDSELQRLLLAMSGNDILKLYRRNIKKAARVLQDETIRIFKSKYNYKGAWRHKVRKKSGERMKTRRIARVTSKIKSGNVIVKVHIMDDYRAKWLEMGTRNRYTKGRRAGYYKLRADAKRRYALHVGKPARRGRINEGRFFRLAQTRKSKVLMESIRNGISDAIMEEAKKNGIR